MLKLSGNDNHDTSTLLFEESRFIEERKQNKARNAFHKFTFKPSINKKSDSLVKLLGKSFYQRLENFNQTKANNISKPFLILGRIKDTIETNNLIDKRTGQPFFHPMVSKRSFQVSKSVGELSKHNPLNNSYTSQISKKVNESLTLHRPDVKAISQNRSSHKSNSLRSKRVITVASNAPKIPKPPINKQSSEINLRKEQAIAEVLFQKLDSDQDGLITSENICIDSIPGVYLKLLLPLLTELEDLNQTLNFEEFAEAMKALIRTLSPQDRNVFLCGPKKQQADPNLTFHPQINQVSREMSKNLRPYGSAALYDHYIQEKKVDLVSASNS